jgi:hypothetical protein
MRINQYITEYSSRTIYGSHKALKVINSNKNKFQIMLNNYTTDYLSPKHCKNLTKLNYFNN